MKWDFRLLLWPIIKICHIFASALSHLISTASLPPKKKYYSHFAGEKAEFFSSQSDMQFWDTYSPRDTGMMSTIVKFYLEDWGDYIDILEQFWIYASNTLFLVTVLYIISPGLTLYLEVCTFDHNYNAFNKKLEIWHFLKLRQVRF